MTNITAVESAIYLRECGFNVTTATTENKRPYVPIRKNPNKWTRDNPLTKEEILQSIERIKAEGKEPLIGFFPGPIKEGKYQGFYTWAIDFDDKDLVEKLQITLEQCKRKGIWLEPSKTKGYHLYGISKLTAHDEKLHDLSIELFGTSNTFILVYGNFKHDFYELIPRTIEKNWKNLQVEVKKVKGIKTQVAEKPSKMEGIEADCIKNIFKGGLKENTKRNDTAFALASWYKNVKRMNPTETRILVNSWNKRNKPPLPERELNLSIVSAQTSGKTTGCSKMRQLGFCPYKHIKDCLFLNPQKEKEELEKKKTINIPINDKSIQVKILGKNKFQLNNGKQIVYPMTSSTSTTWYTSAFYRRKITKALINFYDIKENMAEQITNEICSKAQARIHELNKAKAFKKPLGDELEDILGCINKVECTRSEDTNIYQIHIDGEIIRLKDRELYDGPKEFCVQYLNRFFKKIIIDPEIWNENFISHLLSEDVLIITEQKVEANVDVVRERFFQYVKNKKVLNWEDMDKRVGYKDSVYHDKKNNYVRVSSALINSFFEREKISAMYKVSVVDLNNDLREKNFLIRRRLTGKVEGTVQSFWIFKPEDLDITEQDVIQPIGGKEKKGDKEKPIEDYT